jgi:hypothetical protein
MMHNGAHQILKYAHQRASNFDDVHQHASNHRILMMRTGAHQIIEF